MLTFIYLHHLLISFSLYWKNKQFGIWTLLVCSSLRFWPVYSVSQERKEINETFFMLKPEHLGQALFVVLSDRHNLHATTIIVTQFIILLISVKTESHFVSSTHHQAHTIKSCLKKNLKIDLLPFFFFFFFFLGSSLSASDSEEKVFAQILKPRSFLYMHCSR